MISSSGRGRARRARCCSRPSCSASAHVQRLDADEASASPRAHLLAQLHHAREVRHAAAALVEVAGELRRAAPRTSSGASGPNVPALRYAILSSTGNWARASSKVTPARSAEVPDPRPSAHSARDGRWHASPSTPAPTPRPTAGRALRLAAMRVVSPIPPRTRRRTTTRSPRRSRGRGRRPPAHVAVSATARCRGPPATPSTTASTASRPGSDHVTAASSSRRSSTARARPARARRLRHPPSAVGVGAGGGRLAPPTRAPLVFTAHDLLAAPHGAARGHLETAVRPLRPGRHPQRARPPQRSRQFGVAERSSA